MQTPPVISGSLPVVGHAVAMLQDRDRLFRRGYQEKGKVFAIKLGPQYAAVVSGPDYNRLVYTETDRTLNMQDAYEVLAQALGKVLFVADKETYYNQRPLIQEIFRRERMVTYIQAMNAEIQRWLDGLGDHGWVNMTSEMVQLTQYVAGHALIGPNFREELSDDFWEDYNRISDSMDPVLPQSWPLPKFIRRDRAKARIRETFAEVIERRRQNPDQYDDLITTLLTVPLKDGTYMDDDAIVNLFIGLLFAGHETTAGQAAWGIALLLQHPDYMQLVQQEIDEKITDIGATSDHRILSQLTYIYYAIDETTRMHPSADMQIRTADEDIQMGDYLIPAGWRVIVSGSISHYLPDVFENPHQFDPMRFSPERGEGKNPFAITGFGGGIHKCTGINFARNEMAIITALLFKQFDVQLLSEEIHTVQSQGAHQPSDILVRYQRKGAAEETDVAADQTAS